MNRFRLDGVKAFGPGGAWTGLLAALGVLLVAGTLTYADEAQKVDNPHGKLRDECSTCHDAKGWKPAHISRHFDHSRFGFALTGAHATSACMSCHTSLKFADAKTQCVSCHKDPHRGELGTDCARCHDARSFVDRAPMVRAHQLTRFPLTGGHTSVDCESCHRPAEQGQMQFVGTPTDCASCHMTQYDSAKNPDHVAGGFPTACQTCHTMVAWTTATFDHNRTAFPLTGAHVTTACASCHGDGVYKGKPTDCASCHMSQFNSATPNHATAGFPANQCATCHTTTTWGNGTFDHNTQTTFPLTGAHGSVACSGCHGDGVFKGKSTDCASCHMTQYNSATPNHVAASFPASSCASCHNTTQWAGAVFNHNTQTSFPLTGAHVSRACTDCHGDGVFKGKPTDCLSCHQTQFNAATPQHNTTNFPDAQCGTCHTTTAWPPGQFNHNDGLFALTGAHVGGACTSCHGDGVYNAKPTDCASCHMTEYNSATPNHVTAGFAASACATCHTTTQWAGAVFNHNTQTSFPLTGAHAGAGVTCAECHGDGVYKGKPTDCLSCHQANFSAATPPHNTTNFPDAQCGTCHTTTAWPPGQFNHNDGVFALTGAHVTGTCVSCHGDGVYNAKPTDCASCHMTEYNAATPNHTASGFPASACAGCHNTTQWAGATFNHNDGIFPLTGAHAGASVTCAECHGDGVYQGKPTDCLSCHQANFTAAVPAHNTTYFPDAQCGTCHNTTAWTGGLYSSHDASWFPIYSGSHKGRWSLCTDCHLATPTYSSFSCTNGSCHPQASTNNNHSGVKNYVYNSVNCYSCHPRGSGG